ncbi:MAG: hypothetical protein JWP32_1935 [Schumannella sp.]|nr:hypothetical protein [Schumannella sp.]
MRHVSLLVVAALTTVVAGCAPMPVQTPGPDALCPPALVTEHTNVELTAVTAALAAPVFPMDDLVGAGDRLACTAHLTVTYADGRIVESDLALFDTPVADLAGHVDAATVGAEWTVSTTSVTWRDTRDQRHLIQVLEIEEGTLVAVTEG